MIQSQSILDVIDVAAPCWANWDAMTGDDRVRFCGECKLNVYNLSGMTRTDAETLINDHEGQFCARFYRRADGTILTTDCPVGLKAIRRRLARTLAAMAAVLGSLTFGTLYARASAGTPPGFPHATGPLAKLVEWVDGEYVYPPLQPIVQGKLELLREEVPLPVAPDPLGNALIGPPKTEKGPAK